MFLGEFPDRRCGISAADRSEENVSHAIPASKLFDKVQGLTVNSHRLSNISSFFQPLRLIASPHREQTRQCVGEFWNAVSDSPFMLPCRQHALSDQRRSSGHEMVNVGRHDRFPQAVLEARIATLKSLKVVNH
ncbi:MAG: hypothetical protein QGG36_06065 [Pirellulaceae bacterium]|nr:hypothetical protein [Pirellulaceae bacterium]MDP7015343.1 hypothetical protein [Pirellulaceae bacterium]